MSLINYQRAKQILESRGLFTTSDEIAIWVNYGDPEVIAYLKRFYADQKRDTRIPSGLPAYNKNRKAFQIGALLYTEDGAREFTSAFGTAERVLEVLYRASFDQDEISNFIPDERYLTYVALCDRWTGLLGKANAIAFIEEQIHAQELNTHHCFPPFSEISRLSLYAQSQIKGIEEKCLSAFKKRGAKRGAPPKKQGLVSKAKKFAEEFYGTHKDYSKYPAKKLVRNHLFINALFPDKDFAVESKVKEENAYSRQYGTNPRALEKAVREVQSSLEAAAKISTK